VNTPWNRKPNSVARVSDAPLESWSNLDLWTQVARVYIVTNGRTDLAAITEAIEFTRAEAIGFVRRSADVIREAVGEAAK